MKHLTMKSESTLPRRTSPLTWWTSTRPPPLLTIFIGSNPCLLPSLHIWSKCWILLQIWHFMLNCPEWWLKISLSRKFSQDDMYWKCVGSYIWFSILCQLLCITMWNLVSEKIKRIVLSYQSQSGDFNVKAHKICVYKNIQLK